MKVHKLIRHYLLHLKIRSVTVILDLEHAQHYAGLNSLAPSPRPFWIQKLSSVTVKSQENVHSGGMFWVKYPEALLLKLGHRNQEYKIPGARKSKQQTACFCSLQSDAE